MKFFQTQPLTDWFTPKYLLRVTMDIDEAEVVILERKG